MKVVNDVSAICCFLLLASAYAQASAAKLAPSDEPHASMPVSAPFDGGDIAVRIYSDSNCRNLQLSFTMPNDPSLCQSLGGNGYIKGQCTNGQIIARVYATSDCSGAFNDADLVRENTCGVNVFGGSGQSSSYTCPGSMPPAAPAPVASAPALTVRHLTLAVIASLAIMASL